MNILKQFFRFSITSPDASGAPTLDEPAAAHGFARLPHELLGTVMHHAPAPAVKNLAATNRALRALFRERVETLRVKGCDLGEAISRFPNVRDITLMPPIRDADLGHLARAPSLVHLRFENCEILSDLGLEHLALLDGLTSLDLSGYRHITERGVAHLAPLSRLETLDISDCIEVSGAGLGQLKNLARLSRLSFHNADDEGVAQLQGLPGLRFLDLSGSIKLTDAGLRHLASLQQLEELRLDR